MKDILLLIIFLLAVFLIFLYFKYKNIKFLYDRKEEINNAMLRISEDITDYKDLNEIYQKILNDTINLIGGAEYGSILIFNKDTGFMEYKACSGYNIDLLSNIYIKKEELYLYRTKKLVLPDIIKNPAKFNRKYMDKATYRSLRKNDALDIKSSLSAPIYIKGHFYGIINVDSISDVDAFDNTDIRLIQYIVRQMEISITNALLIEELKETSRIDKLSGLYNRFYFKEIMEKQDEKIKLQGGTFYLAMIDMDNFKSINDNYGHKMGDEVIRYFSDVLISLTGENDLVVRYAGDEFIIVFFNSDEEYVNSVIYKIRKCLERYPYKNIEIQFSVGVCKHEAGKSIDSIISSADNDMYIEKRSKKN